MITLTLLSGYWTLVVNGKPLMSFASLAAGRALVPEAVVIA